MKSDIPPMQMGNAPQNDCSSLIVARQQNVNDLPKKASLYGGGRMMKDWRQATCIAVLGIFWNSTRHTTIVNDLASQNSGFLGGYDSRI
jgi:hypothetical protein